MGALVPGVNQTVLLLGGGAASLICAETLRQEHFGGRIIMVTRDELLTLRQNPTQQGNECTERQYSAEEDGAVSLDTDKKTVTFDEGLVQSYDQLLISTGCRAKALDVPGTKLDNIKMLETPEDARQIHAACLGHTSPLLLSEKNLKFYMNDNVTEIKGVDGKVKEVVLKSGKVIPADVLIVCIGIKANSEFLRSSKIQLDQNNFVTVDKDLKHNRVTCAPNSPSVYCGGDLATFPLAMAKNRMSNIGHWQMAQAHGYGEGYTDIVIKGKFEDKKFLGLYMKNDEVIAAVSLNYDPALSAVAERFAAGKVITREEAESDDLSWLQVPRSTRSAPLNTSSLEC
ncbi:hypothetical protein KUCAC02_002935 [Chaenocephalus aceratus]|uniref:Uncharacterized protein n=1 Tax=Chaenocephalus aceratus TaxID=36190 RepID=A0ACB9WKM0_CHAAC|nr:hypothetical protein KUCAC02_002935 [Chaenocephalus aceratus]